MVKDMTRRAVPLAAGFALCLAAECFGASATSAPSVVWTQPEQSLQWKTVMYPSAEVALDWPAGAASARITVDDTVTNVTRTSATSVTWVNVLPASPPADIDDERILDLTVEYLDGGDATITNATASVGYVTGVNGNATRLITDTNSSKWAKAEKDSVVELPEGSSALAFDSAAQTMGEPPCWWGLPSLGSGAHTLSVSFGGETYTASLLPSLIPTSIYFR